MKDLIFITGNQHKADYVARWLEHPIKHKKLDLDELQSVDLKAVAEHKVRQAYNIVKQPVLVDDASLVFDGMGRLPGTLVRLFLDELGNERLAQLAHAMGNATATAQMCYAVHDGSGVHIFKGVVKGWIAKNPRGSGGHGYDAIFIPEGHNKTRAELAPDVAAAASPRASAIQQLANLLRSKQNC